MDPSRIRHIAICAKDPQRVAEFYERTFGLRKVAQTPDGVAVYLSDGHINFAIIRADERRPEGMYHFGFTVDDVETAAATAVANGGTGPFEQILNARNAEAFIRDPAGTRVDISAHGWSLMPT